MNDVFVVKEVTEEKVVDGRVTAVRFKDGGTAKVVDNCPINFVEYKLMEAYYIELDCGCTIRYACDEEHAWQIARSEADSYDVDVNEVRVATQDDIDWVKSMHGRI